MAFEELYLDSQLVADHKDMEDTDQAVKVEEPELKATATINGEKVVDWQGEVTLTDVVSYSGLTVGKAYTVKGVLMDKTTGEPLLIEDKQIAVEAQFVPEETEGTV